RRACCKWVGDAPGRRKITAPHRRSHHNIRSRRFHLKTLVLVGGQEKDLVSKYRSGNCSAEIVSAQAVFGQRRRAEVPSSVQLIVAQKLERAAVQGVCARLEMDGYVCAGAVSVFGRVVAALNTHLLDGVQGWVIGDEAETVVRDGDPVN